MHAEKDDPKHGLPGGKSKEEFLAEVRERKKRADDYWNPLFRRALDDMKFAFVPDCQTSGWFDKNLAGRPRFTFNRLRQSIKQVTNDQRQNRPQIKVRPEEEADRDLAEIRQGLMRGIESRSNADAAYDEAMKFAVGGGFGAWRIKAGYLSDESFDQDLMIDEILNPYSVKYDPDVRKRDRRDAMYCFIEQQFPRNEYKRRWPKADIVDFKGGEEWTTHWCKEDSVLVCEYLFKEPIKSTILLLTDGRVVRKEEFDPVADESALAGVFVAQRREVERYKVWHYLVSGADILEKTELPGKFIPVVPVWGDILNVEGKDDFCGMVQFSKDAQLCYNFERSVAVEALADQPLNPFWAAAEAVKGYEDSYRDIRVNNDPVMFYNVVPNLPNGGRPQKDPGPTFPAAYAQAAQISAEDIKATSGKFDASLGARSNETSGRAIAMRQREGDVSSFDYIDNLTRAIKYSFEIVNDLIPHIYDTERQVRLLGEDMAEKVVTLNQPVFDQQSGQWITLNDMSRGTYDLAVTVGPSYTTQRMEMADAMQSMANAPGPAGMLATYGWWKALDAPGMDEMLKGFRKVLVGQGLLEPEEGEQPPAPPQPNPKDVADAKRSDAQAEKYAADAQGKELENQRNAYEWGLQTMAAGPPMYPPITPQMGTQPPRGGFLMPGETGYPQ